MEVANPKKAKKYFKNKLEFTTGPVELSEMIKRRENIKIIDVRMPEDYLKGHIPGAVNISRENWGDVSPLSKDDTNVVYCYSETCHLAASAAKNFAEHDFPVMELQGGFEDWEHHNLPTES